MAKWKKVIVSESNAAIKSLTASAAYPLKLSGVGINSTDKTPLVIDSDGNVRSGSTYLAKYGDHIVSGAGTLTSNNVIVGNNGSGIQNATSTTDANFNSADVYGIANITASAYHLNGDRQFVTGSPDSGVILGDKDTKLYLTGSTIIISSSGGITGSVIPTTVKPPFFLGLSSSGEFVKIDERNVGQDGGGLTGILEGTNIDIDGFSTTEELFFADKIAVIDNAFSITGSNASIQNSQTLESPNEIRIKYSDGTEETRVVAEFTQSVDGDASLFGIKLTAAITDAIDTTENHIIYKLVTVETGTPVISLEPSITITGSTTIGTDLIFSTSSGVAHDHSIHMSSGDTLNITASNISASGTITANQFDIDGFQFANTTTLVSSASSQFGDELSDKHGFTGSVSITSSLNLAHANSTDYFNVSTSLANTTQSVHLISGGLVFATASIHVVSSALSTYSQSIHNNTVTSSFATASIHLISGGLVNATASIHAISGGLVFATASIHAISTSLSTVKSFPYAGGDTVGSDQAIITGSLLVGDTVGSTEAGSGHITASGHISASAVTASNMHVATNLHVGGNLTVFGSNTVIDSTNLTVEDRFILLGSGSGTPEVAAEGENPAQNATVLDTGIIFESGSVGSGVGLFFNSSENRISIGKQINDAFMSTNADTANVDHVGGETQDGIVAGQVVTVRDLSGTVGTSLTDTPGVGSTNVQFGVGEMVVDSSNDIWIYTG